MDHGYGMIAGTFAHLPVPAPPAESWIDLAPGETRRIDDALLVVQMGRQPGLVYAEPGTTLTGPLRWSEQPAQDARASSIRHILAHNTDVGVRRGLGLLTAALMAVMALMGWWGGVWWPLVVLVVLHLPATLDCLAHFLPGHPHQPVAPLDQHLRTRRLRIPAPRA